MFIVRKDYMTINFSLIYHYFGNFFKNFTFPHFKSKISFNFE